MFVSRHKRSRDGPAPVTLSCEESGTVARDQECVAGTEDQVRKQSADNRF